MLTSIDLFSGPGGLCTGFKWAGIKPLIAVEMSYWTVQTYAASHNADILELDLYIKNELPNSDQIFNKSDKTVIIHGDINKVTIELIKKILKERFGTDTVDIVTGGAPCESFSMAGKRTLGDDRDSLFMHIPRIAGELNAKMFMFENVKGLFSKKISTGTGKMFDAVCDFMELPNEHTGVRYKLANKNKDTILLNSADYGVPQARERLFLVGINDKYDVEFKYPEASYGDGKDNRYVTVADALMDLPQIDAGMEYEEYNWKNGLKDSLSAVYANDYVALMRGGNASMPVPQHINFNSKTLRDHKAVNHRENMIKRMELIQEGEGMKAAVDRLIEQGQNDLVQKYFPKKIYAARNRRLSKEKPSFTVTSHCLDEMIHPTANRGLTPREAARLQSFPDWYIFQGPYVKFHGDPEQDRYEQIGDAIPPLLAYILGMEIAKTLNKVKGKNPR